MDDPTGGVRWRLMLLAIFVSVAVAGPIVMLTYPIPDIPSGWCPSGGRSGHYTVETVARVALQAEILAVAGIVLLLASWMPSWAGRIAVGLAAAVPGVVILYLADIFYAGRIDCAFS